MPNNTWSLLTPPNMGAIAIIQIAGDVQPVLCKLTNRSTWEHGNLYLVNIEGIDEVIAVQIDDRLAQVMPHGGVHILRKLTERFEELDVAEIDEQQFPEAGESIEAQMLAVLAVAESPLAVELLLSQPAKLIGASCSQTDATRALTLNHLITPPKVVLLGSPNTGKSTLMNALTKQDTSIVHDLPGATRDAVGARVNCAGLVLDLFDLPGFRDSEDAIEQEAISIAKNIAKEATLTILIADDKHEWLKTNGIDMTSIKVATKADCHKRDDADICVSAHTGENMQQLAVLIRDAIVPADVLQDEGPWFFTGYSPTEE